MSLRKGSTMISGLGSDGYSPTANVSRVNNVVTVSITDKNGTTSEGVNIDKNVVSSLTSTYTINSLVGNMSYKLGEITALTISSATVFDIETVIYFESGNTPTVITLPASITNIGDNPTFTETSGTNQGTCEVSKSYIIAIENNIAVWKEY